MAYRHNQLGAVQKAQYEEAKAALEQLAEQEYVHLPQAESALQTMGFRKEAELRHNYAEPSALYRRETAGGIELLIDRDLANLYDKTPHLYRLPAGQDVEEWVISVHDYAVQKDRKAGRIAEAGGVALGGAISVNALSLMLYGGAGDNIVLGTFIILASVLPTLFGAVAFKKILMRKGPLGKELVAKGAEALHYIAHTKCDAVADTKYDAPKLRIETEARIADAGHQTELEALAEESAQADETMNKKTAVKKMIKK